MQRRVCQGKQGKARADVLQILVFGDYCDYEEPSVRTNCLVCTNCPDVDAIVFEKWSTSRVHIDFMGSLARQDI